MGLGMSQEDELVWMVSVAHRTHQDPRLSHREQEVTKKLVQGKDLVEIAVELGLHIVTVRRFIVKADLRCGGAGPRHRPD